VCCEVMPKCCAELCGVARYCEVLQGSVTCCEASGSGVVLRCDKRCEKL
jgi:hypothetical protein